MFPIENANVKDFIWVSVEIICLWNYDCYSKCHIMKIGLEDFKFHRILENHYIYPSVSETLFHSVVCPHYNFCHNNDVFEF